MDDTIYALATPAGKSGVAVVRLSGGSALEIAQNIAGKLKNPRQAYFRELKSKTGSIIDHALVIYFAAPASFTGEDVVEFHIHGGRAVIEAVLNVISEFDGVRMAASGEFTKRALLNGKLDLLQVEALGDFINADTEAQRKLAMSGYQGDAARWVSELRDNLVHAMSLVTAMIDFVDEELPASIHDEMIEIIEHTNKLISSELKRAKKSKALQDGYRVAIIGKPNVGKSSLLNAIAGREVAIATDVPGTTRDTIELFLNINGLPVILIDTAGIRETDDKVEHIGVNRALKAAEAADLRVFLYENDEELAELSISPKRDDIILRSKADLVADEDQAISAKTGHGVDQLIDDIGKYFSDYDKELGYFSHDRQINTLKEAQLALTEAMKFANIGEVQYDFLAEALRQAVFSLDRLIGKVDVEDMLDFIFSKFCIGK